NDGGPASPPRPNKPGDERQQEVKLYFGPEAPPHATVGPERLRPADARPRENEIRKPVKQVGSMPGGEQRRHANRQQVQRQDAKRSASIVRRSLDVSPSNRLGQEWPHQEKAA